MPVPRVHGIREQAATVGAHIQHHRDHTRRVDSSSRGIDRQFSNGDFDSTHAPIADSEDLFGIRSQNQIDIVWTSPQISEGFLDGLRMIDGKVYTPRTPALVVILLHCKAYGAIVDDRDH